MALGRANPGRPRDNSVRSNSAAGGKGGYGVAGVLSRRALLAGGFGVTALVAMPDLARTAGAAASTSAASTAPGHFFLYGVTGPEAVRAAGVHAVSTPASRSARASAPVPLATDLAATPVASPDQKWLALATVSATSNSSESPPSGADPEPVITVTIVAKASAALAQQAVVSLRGVPADSSVLVTPVFSPDASVVSLVMGISVPRGRRQVRADPSAGGSATAWTPEWRSQHALAYFDRRTGAVAGPFYLDDEPSLALSTAVATAADLFVWTTEDPRAPARAKSHPAPPPLPWVSVFPLGAGKPRLRVPSPAPWPGGEPAGALASGDAARFVNARTLQVAAAKDGEITLVTVAPLAAGRAKPSLATMTPRPDGTLFLAKPAIGRAVILDPAREFAVRNDISFAAPARPFGGLGSKAVLSPTGDRLYVLGGAKSGGLAVYDVATGTLAGAYGDGREYSGVYLLPGGTLLAVSQESPRLAYFSLDLSPLGTADTSLFISAVY